MAKKKKRARFDVYRISRDSSFRTVESRKEHLADSFGMMKESWVARKCVGREGASKVTDYDFEKARKLSRLLKKS